MMMNGRESGSGRLPGGRAGIGHSGHLFAQLVSHIARLVGHIAPLVWHIARLAWHFVDRVGNGHVACTEAVCKMLTSHIPREQTGFLLYIITWIMGLHRVNSCLACTYCAEQMTRVD